MKKLFMLMIVLLVVTSPLSASKSLQENGVLQKGAIVCKNVKSIHYLLKNNKNYQKVINELELKNFYKNCFLSISETRVKVITKYSSKYLMKNYYMINHFNKKQYVSIDFIDPIVEVKKSYKHYYSQKSKKKYSGKKIHHNKKIKRVYEHKKSKKHTFKKKRYTQKSKRRKHINQSNKIIKSKNSYKVKKQKQKIASKVQHKAKNNSKHKLKNILDQYTANTIKVYRCSAVSFDESFTGQHADKEKSKQIALNNCHKYQKGDAICLFESCYILRLSAK